MSSTEQHDATLTAIPEQEFPTKPEQPFPIIGIGSGEGGLEAAQTFFEHMPPTSGAAFVVLLHGQTTTQQDVATALQARTSMPVVMVNTRMPIQPDRLYLVPASAQLEMSDGFFHVTEAENEEFFHAPIDHFLRVLARVQSRYAIALILSGGGSDGTLGLKRVKELGGSIFIQDPEDAAVGSMARSAIATGLADYILPVAAIPDMLLTYLRRAQQITSVESHALVDTETSLRDVLALLRVRTHHDFSLYKRPTILRRIARRMQVMGVADLTTYVDVLRNRPDEIQALLQDLLISVTNFFRDPEAWDALESIIPLLFAGKSSDDQVRIWVTACATGEEAYTVAMLVLEYALVLDHPPSIQIFASDIDNAAIGQARRGIYPKMIEGDVSATRLARFFVYEQGRYRVKQELRDMVLFAHHNVLRDPPFSHVDLITCRNLLIYLNREAQEQVARLFNFSLRPGGYVLMGNAETLEGVTQYFDVVTKGQRLFKQKANNLFPPVQAASLGRAPLPEIRNTRQDQRVPQNSLEELHQRLMLASAPPSIILNEDYDIVHLSTGVGRYFQFDAGLPTVNLMRVVLPELRMEIRSTLFRAQHQGNLVTSPYVRLNIGDSVRSVAVIVEQIREVDWPSGYFLVRFVEIDVAPEAHVEIDASSETIIQDLEADLLRTREQLQLTMEAHETAGEEYKAANEELTAINEELRAASEELETSKEELQALNEELTTVNLELKYKVDEISITNNDLQNFIAATQIGTIFLDRELCIMRYTPSVEAIFNLIPTDIHRPLAHLTHSLKYDGLQADARTVLASLIPTAHEVETTAGAWYLMQLRPYRTNDDRIAGVVITFIDITERKQAERERERLLHEAETALDVRNQFLSIASHELRTPLTPLLGYTNMLRTSLGNTLDEPQSRIVESIERQTKRLGALIGTLLDVARLQRGQFILDPQPLDLGELVEHIVDDFRLMLPFQASKHAIVLERSNEPLMVIGDASRFEEILQNLLDNAVKYSPSGGDVIVRVSRRTREVVLEVTDHGLGIPANRQQDMFEPFVRLEQRGPRTSGFGLGLYIVREIINRHYGRIEVESEEGEGTTFRVILPTYRERTA